MKKALIAFSLIFTVTICCAQHKKSDTLLVAFKNAKTDTTRLIALLNLGKHYYLSLADSAIIFGQQAYEIADKNKWISQKGRALNSIANAYASMGDYLQGMQFYLKSLRTYESIHDLRGASSANNNIGATYVQEEDYKNAIPYLRTAGKQLHEYGLTHKFAAIDNELDAIILENIGETYLNLKQVDSAEFYLEATSKEALTLNFTDIIGAVLRDLGEVEEDRNDEAGALKYFREAVVDAIAIDDIENLSIAYLSEAKFYHKEKAQDSAEYYAKKAISIAASGKYEQDVLNGTKALTSYYDEDGNIPEAYKYFKLTTAAKDSLYSQDKVKQLLSLDFDEKQHQRDVADAREQVRYQVRFYTLITGLLLVLLLAFIFWRNNRKNEQAKRLLQQQKEQIQATLGELETTQNQLVQSAKMASLGELTAGIAHEIQNPLNFVNNFSELNEEMMNELEDSLKAGKTDEALALAADIKENEKKIRHHGKRADFIVKGMLEHSRISTGEKQLTDINVLADEFFKLSYHGLRAKDKNFNAELVTHFDRKLPKLEVVQQDIGRILLNLFNNAFYAVGQKQKTAALGYKPTVEVTTFAPPSAGGSWGVIVRDNGNGIADAL
jgi:two-component system NtrC family sensor kinase